MSNPVNFSVTDNAAAQSRLDREICILRDGEARFDLPTQEVIVQLIRETARPLPQVLPPVPKWARFEWPVSGRC